MNTDTDLEDPKTQLVVALESLFERDDRWRPVPSPEGATVTLTRCWREETVDTVVLLSPDTTYAWREDSRGREVERIRGTAEQVIVAVRDWPAP